MHEICIIGHVTKDTRGFDGCHQPEAPGGVVHYAGIAARRLGLETAVLTKAAAEDAPLLLAGLHRAGVTVDCRACTATSSFEIRMDRKSPHLRTLVLRESATPFEPAELGGISASTIHLGPVVPGEMSAAFVAAAAARARRLSLDVQGLVRGARHGRIALVRRAEGRRALRHVDIVKADLDEARILTGTDDPEATVRALAAMGPEEAIVTLGDRGAIIFDRSAGRLHRIPAIPPRTFADDTGCGDSFCAGYLFRRMRGGDVAAAGRFAAAVASPKLETAGPFSADRAAVERRLAAIA